MLGIFKPRRLLLLGGALATAGGGFAFMASNTVAASNAGVGGGTISGYTVGDVSYALVTNPLTPGGTYIQQVNFTLTPGTALAGNVLAWFEDSSGNFVSGYYSCTAQPGSNATLSTWNCQNPNVINGDQWAATGAAGQLHVSASQ
jgi:hypothetical protein